MIKILILVFGICPTEDSTTCVWDAANHGNGIGVSFLSLGELTVPLQSR